MEGERHEEPRAMDVDAAAGQPADNGMLGLDIGRDGSRTKFARSAR
jgi:hypothetical protein